MIGCLALCAVCAHRLFLPRNFPRTIHAHAWPNASIHKSIQYFHFTVSSFANLFLFFFRLFRCVFFHQYVLFLSFDSEWVCIFKMWMRFQNGCAGWGHTHCHLHQSQVTIKSQRCSMAICYLLRFSINSKSFNFLRLFIGWMKA